jgi:teichuronic acid biosynthesis glycosyltransferase TuaG
MVKKNLVDIILPVYNSEKFIIKTINSIINQTCDSWRIIIIDDSSSDKTLKVVCDYYKDFIYKKKILILKNSINRGQAYCRNLGLKYSKSEFIAFIDSDDLWIKKKLENQIKFMKKTDSVFSYTDYEVYKRYKRKKIYVPVNFTYSTFVLNTSIATSTVIIKKKIINNLFPSNVRLCEDYVFKCKLLKKYNANKCSGMYTKYFIRQNSLQSSRIKVLLAVWSLNKNFNSMNIIQNLLSVLFISINSFLKYGIR